MFTSRLMVLIAAHTLMAGLAFADDSAIGYVKTVTGDAMVLASGEAQNAQPGTPVRIGDVLKTGQQGSMGVTFKDNTIVSLGPDTEITVDEYLFSPGNDDLKFTASMAQGTLNYVSGIIAKLRPESVTLNTPTGIIGVRGTHFLAKVKAEH